MYAYIKGTLIAFTPIQATVDVQGIGYHLFITCNALGQLPQPGNTVQFFTSFVVREFAHSLYGFLTAQERDVFELLMNITGVGPKLALSLIGHLPGSCLQEAITHEDLTTLCKVPGVGKKTAERLIVELRDKAPSLLSPTANLAIQIQLDEKGHVQDAVLALINLGYSQANAQKAIKSSLKDLPKNYELTHLLTAVLQNIHKA